MGHSTARLCPSQGTIAMSVDGNKNALNRPIGEDGKREWSYDIVDPSGWGCRTCIRSTRTVFSYADHLLFFPPLSSFLAGCFVTWCPCMIYSRNMQHLRSLQIEGTPLPPGNERTIDANCCIYSGLRVVLLHWTLQVRPGYASENSSESSDPNPVGADRHSQRNP
jgi:hypothetical protein